MEIFKTKYWTLTHGWQEHDALATRLSNVLERAGVRDHIPFILAADGSYDVRLNQFFRELPTNGVRSPRSWRNYALDILTWIRFLAEYYQKTIWDATHADLVSFHTARRGATRSHRDLIASSSATAQIDASSWNRCIAALDKFYRWAFTQHYIREIPFTYRQGQSFYGEFMVTTQRNEANERGARHGDMRFLSLEDYVCFREVGLRGRLPDGQDDPSFRGRNGARNVAFAELLVTTGMRLTEANSLLMLELPRYLSTDTKKKLPVLPGSSNHERRKEAYDSSSKAYPQAHPVLSRD
ncbi:MAG TPA: site-specific integrase [Ktedonobacteraceae bacterium]|nr:site-specific integrase [Ktedonobacteraceae bacterium]